MAANSPRSVVTMALVLESARAEFMKLDRPINEADFHYPGPAVIASKPASRNGEAVLV
jgi:hypothetical protein